MALTGNILLDAFSPALLRDVLEGSRKCYFEPGRVLVRRDSVPAHLVFLTSGLASLVITMEDGGTSEVGLVGFESMTGVFTLLHSTISPTQCVVQIAGNGIQVSRQRLAALFQASAEFRDSILRLAHCQMSISAQLSACNLRHGAEGRFARWLLSASDRTGSATVNITQEALGDMLSVRRATVSVVTAQLYSQNLIRKDRGSIVILDRQRLLSVACECYEICRGITYPTAHA